MHHSSRALLYALGVAALAGLTATAQAQTYTLTDLGTLGGSRSFATDVNNSGQVVGNSLTSDGSTHAFLYNGGGSIKDLGTTVYSSNYFGSYVNVGTDSYANSINNKGQIAGYIYGSSFGSVGFVSTSNSATLNGLNIGNDYATVAVGINDKGQVAGESNGGGAFFIDPKIGLDSVVKLQGVYNVRAMNDNGQILGYLEESEAYLSGPDGSPGKNVSNLGALHYSGYDVNDSGQVVGQSDDMAQGYDNRAYLTGSNGGTPVTDLGSLAPNPISGGAASEGHGVNNKDQVVGSAGTASDYNLNRAFLWENGVMTDLNSLIAPGSGFTLTDATAISDTGYIVGNGTDAFGHDHAFLLSPAAVPEASTTVSFGLLLALGTGAMAIKRRKAARQSAAAGLPASRERRVG